MKRVGGAMDEFMPAEKAMNTGGPPPPEGQGEPWTCRQCQNVNWPLRTTCNNKQCKAPGPWTCPSCSNRNFQGRMVCNKPQCRQPNPMAATGGGCMGGPPMGKGGMMMGGPPAFGGFQAKGACQGGFPGGGCGKGGFQGCFPGGCCGKGGFQGGCGGGGCAASGAPAGSWTCQGCNNVNWPLRMSCNNKTCGLPKPELVQQAFHQGCGGKGGCGAGGGKGGGKVAPEGSWRCVGCENVNWPLRQTCNNKECALPRDQADGGPPSQPDMLAKESKEPPAEQGEKWQCPACDNVNWPLRTVCNNKNCLQPRPEL